MNLPFDLHTPDLADPTCIEMNRRGQISEAQKSWLNNKVGLFFSCFSMIGTALVVPGLLLFVFVLLAVLRASIWIVLGYGALAVLGSVAYLALTVGRMVMQVSAVKKDIAAGLVQCADGYLDYGRSSYEAAVSNGTRLKLPEGWSGLVPGVLYRFYYLPGSRTILSGETVKVMNLAQGKQALLNILAKANRFKADQLEANRSGWIAPTQIPRLLKHLFFGAVFFFPGILLAGYLVYAYFFDQTSNSQNNWLILLVALLVGGGFILVGGFILFNTLIDLFASKAASIEGEGRRIRKTSRSRSGKSSGQTTVTYYYRVAEKDFQVPKRAFHAMVEGLRYRAYYTPRSTVLLSIEPLEPPVREEEN